MRFSKTILSSSAALLLFANLTAQDQHDTNNEEKAHQHENLTPGHNKSCRVTLQNGNDYNFLVSASFIYWQPIQENMRLGVVSNSTDSLDLVNGYEVDLDFKYKPGFKVGIGTNFNYDGWDTFAEYTWFRATERAQVNLNTNNELINLLPAWQISNFLNPQYHAGSETWSLGMDLVDWDLGRCYRVGKLYRVRSFIGLRSAWIRQNVQVSYTNTLDSYKAIWPSTFINQSSNSWGIGPRFGLNSKWELGHCDGFRINADGEVDILYTRYNLRSSQSSDVDVANRYIVTQDGVDYLRTHLDLKLGLGWGSYFAQKTFHLDILLEYGFQVFFDQNVFRNVSAAESIGKSIIPNGNLYIQGLSLTTKFNF